jgi:O-acetylhomoserine/O-acetylserine sulfhydrylase-like pyridoxal-dependent enzyme
MSTHAAVEKGPRGDANTGAGGVPLHQTAAYAFRNAQEVAGVEQALERSAREEA